MGLGQQVIATASFNEIAEGFFGGEASNSIYRRRFGNLDVWLRNVDPANSSYETQASKTVLDDLGIPYIERDDGKLQVEGDIDLSNRNLKHLPDLRAVIVSGYFNCSHNQLTSLHGAPESVGEFFYCSYNRLRTLNGASVNIGGEIYYYCNPVDKTSAQLDR